MNWNCGRKDPSGAYEALDGLQRDDEPMNFLRDGRLTTRVGISGPQSGQKLK